MPKSPYSRWRLALRWGVVCLLGFSLSACTAARYRKKADKETYKIIEAKSADVPGMAQDFSIERDPDWEPLEGEPRTSDFDESLGEDAVLAADAAQISLEKALQIAVRNSREYQFEREGVFLKFDTLELGLVSFVDVFYLDYSIKFPPGSFDDIVITAPLKVQVPFLGILVHEVVDFLKYVELVNSHHLG